MHLCGKMDSQGWVSLEDVAAFRLVKEKTRDMNVITLALGPSLAVELSLDSKNIRSRDNWEGWVQRASWFKQLGLFKTRPSAMQASTPSQVFFLPHFISCTGRVSYKHCVQMAPTHTTCMHMGILSMTCEKAGCLFRE